jgi:hypothetical protein
MTSKKKTTHHGFLRDRPCHAHVVILPPLVPHACTRFDNNLAVPSHPGSPKDRNNRLPLALTNHLSIPTMVRAATSTHGVPVNALHAALQETPAGFLGEPQGVQAALIKVKKSIARRATMREEYARLHGTSPNLTATSPSTASPGPAATSHGGHLGALSSLSLGASWVPPLCFTLSTFLDIS